MSDQSDGDVAQSERPVVVTVHILTTLNTDRVKEYVLANYADGDQIQIQDIETGENYYDNIGCDSL